MTSPDEAFWKRVHSDDEADFSPTVMDYDRLLDLATKKERISREEARERYGSCTYGQWRALLDTT
jgi:hypothetical protein